MAMKKSRKLVMVGGLVLGMLAVVTWGLSALVGSAAGIDASRLATIERGTMVRSVVATGKIEPMPVLLVGTEQAAGHERTGQ